MGNSGILSKKIYKTLSKFPFFYETIHNVNDAQILLDQELGIADDPSFELNALREIAREKSEYHINFEVHHSGFILYQAEEFVYVIYYRNRQGDSEVKEINFSNRKLTDHSNEYDIAEFFAKEISFMACCYTSPPIFQYGKDEKALPKGLLATFQSTLLNDNHKLIHQKWLTFCDPFNSIHSPMKFTIKLDNLKNQCSAHSYEISKIDVFLKPYIDRYSTDLSLKNSKILYISDDHIYVRVINSKSSRNHLILSIEKSAFVVNNDIKITQIYPTFAFYFFMTQKFNIHAQQLNQLAFYYQLTSHPIMAVCAKKDIINSPNYFLIDFITPNQEKSLCIRETYFFIRLPNCDDFSNPLMLKLDNLITDLTSIIFKLTNLLMSFLELNSVEPLIFFGAISSKFLKPNSKAEIDTIELFIDFINKTSIASDLLTDHIEESIFNPKTKKHFIFGHHSIKKTDVLYIQDNFLWVKVHGASSYDCERLFVVDWNKLYEIRKSYIYKLDETETTEIKENIHSVSKKLVKAHYLLEFDTLMSSQFFSSSNKHIGHNPIDKPCFFSSKLIPTVNTQLDLDIGKKSLRKTT